MSPKVPTTVIFSAFLLNLIMQPEGLLLKNGEGTNLTMLEYKLTALESSVESLKSECACGKNSPAFMAALNVSISHCTTQQPVIFSKVYVNVGSGYKPQHGIFKAPVSGVYAFSTSLSVGQNNHYHVAIVKGNATNEIAYLYSEAVTGINHWHIRSTTVLSHLNIGEEVWMICIHESSIEGDKAPSIDAGDFHSHFSGFLVSLD